MSMFYCFFFFKQKTAYEMRISDWSSDVCSSDLPSAAISSAADPAAATIAPPTAGPTLRAMLKPMELNVTAPRSSGLGTKSPTEACQAGALSAVPQPIRKVKPSNSQGVSTPDQAQNASAVETTSMNPCAQSMTTRRSRLDRKSTRLNSSP